MTRRSTPSARTSSQGEQNLQSLRAHRCSSAVRRDRDGVRACRPSRVELAGEGLESLLVRAKSSVPDSVQEEVLSSRARSRECLAALVRVVRVALGIWVERALGGSGRHLRESPAARRSLWISPASCSIANCALLTEPAGVGRQRMLTFCWKLAYSSFSSSRSSQDALVADVRVRPKNLSSTDRLQIKHSAHSVPSFLRCGSHEGERAESGKGRTERPRSR